MTDGPTGDRGQRVTVVGLGIEGVDLVRYLAGRGARVTVSDARPAAALRAPLDRIADVPGVTLSLGGHRLDDIAGADAVYASQGVPDDLPALREARRRGVPVSSMTRLFFERCPAPVAGVTGSSGKTTTVALVGAMLAADGADHVVGGNIGVGLLSLLDRIGPGTRVVVELSHTQLASLEQSPHIACVTNVTPNHLDRFSWDAYVGLKRRIFAFQRPGDLAILNIDNPICAAFAQEAPAAVATTAVAHPLPGDGVTVTPTAVVRRQHGTDFTVCRREEIRLRGRHNLDNVLSAVAVAAALGVPDDRAAEAIRAFRGVPHRLEPVAQVAGVTWVNDSIATTPERALAGIGAFAEPLVLLLGGRDKHLPPADLARAAATRCRAVVTFGEAAEHFAAAVTAARDGDTPVVRSVADVPAAVAAAAELARPGDVVLFSPAGTSFDAYRTFEERGHAFREAVGALPGARSIDGPAADGTAADGTAANGTAGGAR